MAMEKTRTTFHVILSKFNEGFDFVRNSPRFNFFFLVSVQFNHGEWNFHFHIALNPNH
jgi:hypothetical protein